MKNKTSILKTNGIWYVVIALWAIGCFIFFNWFYRYHFFFQEQNQLFLWTCDYVLTYFNKPAWMACLVGDFLTQFYYYLYLGPVILIVSLLFVGHFTRLDLEKVGLKKIAFPIAIVIMTLEMCLCFKVEYRLESIIALGGGLFLYYITPEKRYSQYYLWVGVPVAFWLFGYGVFAYALMVLLNSFRNKTTQVRLIRVITLFFALILLMFSKKVYYLDYDKLYAYPGEGEYAAPDFLLENFLKVDNEYNWGHYNKVIKVVEETPSEKRSDILTFYYNMAQAQLGALPDRVLNINPTDLGTFHSVDSDLPVIMRNSINELYYLLGDMTFAERTAMITCISSHNNRNVRMIKRLAECNIVRKDTTAAMKYIRLLQKTFVYKKWADEHDISKKKLTDRILLAKQKFVNTKDTIRFNDNSHAIMTELLEANPNNLIALDYLLCSSLLVKDIVTFKNDYDKFCMATGKPRNKPLYQQALMIWLAAKNAPDSEWEKYVMDRQTLERFSSYNNQRMSNMFADNYWYYYDITK